MQLESQRDSCSSLAQVVSNLVSFVILTLLLKDQMAAVDRMTFTFEGLRTSQELLVQLTAMNDSTRGLHPNTSWLSPADLPRVAARMELLTAEFTNHHPLSFRAPGQGRIDS